MTIAGPDLLRDLAGVGIEIGAFHSPLAVGPHAKVTYVDACSPEVARRYFPEVTEDTPVVAPDVLAPADRLPLADSSQDFVLSSHLLEHLADPIAALLEWHRVLRHGGLLFLRVPDQRGSFDRARSRATLDHVIADHREAAGSATRVERDFDHYREWARCVNGLADPGQVDFWARLLRRSAYPIHFHCFIPEDLRAVFSHLESEGTRFSIVAEDARADRFEFTIVAHAEKREILTPSSPPR